MNFNSPVYNWKNNQPVRNQDDFKSPYTSPQNNSPGFSPYSSSSPHKHFRGKMRYFNSSNGMNSSGSNGSPYKQHNRNNRDHFNRKSRSSGESPISSYYDPSALENPWADLEKEYEERKIKESTKS